MRSERLELGDPATVAREIRSRVPAPDSIAVPVAEIVERVRTGGDAALRDYAERLDGLSGSLRAGPPGAPLAAEVRAGLDVAARNVDQLARAGLGEPVEVELEEGQRVVLREEPVRRAAIYVPGGRAPYPSTVVMGVVTAWAAGVEEVVVCAPGAHDVILGACELLGVEEVYAVGGAHAIAALAFGTETIRAVDVIAGPGNLWVTEAKRQVFGIVGIDSLAGPSDVLVLAGSGADPELVALDLMAQAEHGPGTLVVACATDAALLDAVAEQVETAEAVCALVHAPGWETARDFAEAFAPEHLELVGEEAEALAPAVRAAGCVFVGAESAVAFGDYVAGSNHVLPTGGAARFAQALGPRTFRRRVSEVRVGPAAAALAAAGAPVARAEGFVIHAASMEARQNGG